MDSNFIAGKDTLGHISEINALIKQTCIIDYGIIQKVVADGIVEVAVAVAKTPQDMKIMTCVLAGLASDSLTVNVKPKEGDRVLIVYPKLYSEDMFDVPSENEKKTELVIDFNAKGYNMTGGIAVLLNQYKTASHKNYIEADNGNIKLKLAYDKNEDKNLVEIETKHNGDINIKNPHAQIDIDKDGAVTITSVKASLSMDKNGNVIIDSKGKYTIKNNSTDLLSVISDFNTILQSLKTTGSASAQTISPDTITQLMNWETSELKALLD